MSSGQAPSSGAPPQGGASFAPQQAHQPQQPGNQNLNQIVTDYLVKRGYVQTERVFRRETALGIGPDGKPARNPLDTDPARFKRAWILLLGHVDSCLDVFKFELSKLLWPVFVYSFIKLIEEGNTAEAQDFLNHVFTYFKKHHEDDLKVFQTITQKAQILANDTTRLYKENKYQIPLNQHVNDSLYSFLERKYDDGGSVIADILNDSIALHRVDRGPINAFSFEAIYSRGQNVDLQDADVHEGIPGHYTGVTNRDIIDQNQVLKLGPMPMENDLQNDVRAELEELDSKGPPADGRPTLVDEFDRKIKREESADGPSRSDLPLPPSRARDVIMEIQKVRENRDRFKIEGRTGGVPPAVSICMFTFHNTLGAYNCIDFSKDYRFVATGTEDSYIRVWDLAGKPLTSKLPSEKDLKVNNRKLIGHSAAIMSVHFSDSINPPSQNIISEADSDTGPRFLISASMDGQIRLWSLQVWSCLAIYKGHDGPVTRCLWSPHGHYFASGGWDKTVRVWTQDHASHVRLLVGHDTCISEICWHPNGMYIFSASDETDKTIRMWSITTGQCVRLFTGHTDFISALAVAPNGRILASADLGGTIRFWDIDKGTLIKRSRGHQKGGIWSLSFSVESTVLVSGGHDCTVRIWDVAQTTDGKSNTGEAGAGQLDTTLANAQGGSAMAAGSSGPTGSAVGGKKKGKEATVTPDQVSCFPTKRTPVIKVEFSRMNLVVAGGWFEPGR